MVIEQMQNKPNTIPAPDNFPIVWQSPEDEQTLWVAERLHWPDPLPPLDAEIMKYAHEEFSGAFTDYGIPLQYNVRLLNHYWYFAVTPNVSDPAEIPVRMQAGLENLAQTVPHIQDRWNDEWLPEVQAHLAFWENFNLAGATMPELLSHLDETIERHRRVWRIHFNLVFPVFFAMDAFDELYQDLFEDETQLDSYQLTQGFENLTVDMGRALWRLSREAMASKNVHACLEQCPVEDIVPTLEASDEGRRFLSSFQEFLDQYGQRGEKLGVSFPSWSEEPTEALRQLVDYVRQPGLDFDTDRAELAERRERHIEESMARLADYPKPIIEQFESSLRYAQQATVLSEDHAFWIDFRSMHQIRRVVLEFGGRFTDAGILDDAADVFFLTTAEIRESAKQSSPVSRAALVAARQADIAHYAAVSSPPVLGTPPDGPPPDDPLSRTVGKFFGAPPPEPEQEFGVLVLRGGPGSPGSARGVARVVHSLNDARTLEAGEILVTATTAPAWTPLFASVAAVVTDTGGVLCHSAVVAREYGVPAVVGAGMATSVIQSGQLIEVDGDRGVVRIVSTD